MTAHPHWMAWRMMQRQVRRPVPARLVRLRLMRLRLVPLRLVRHTRYFSGTDGMTGWCLNRDKKAKLADISSFSKVGARKEPVMQKYIANEAPLSICVDASSWQTYKKGVVGPATCGKQLLLLDDRPGFVPRLRAARHPCSQSSTLPTCGCDNTSIANMPDFKLPPGACDL